MLDWHFRFVVNIFRMLTLRLRRIGKRQHATYRFIVQEKSRAPQSRVVEFLGSYDPHINPPTVNIKRDRVEHWLKVGAQPSATVHNLLVDAGLLTSPKVKVARPKKKSGEATAVAGQATPPESAAPAAGTPKAEEQKAKPVPSEAKKEEAKA